MKLEIKENEIKTVIKEIRKSQRYTVKEFAELCRFPSYQYLSNLETGQKPATFKTLKQVCDACNYDISITIKTKK
jgi:transcriptional regulator with XRE-family HTH domain